MNFFSPDIPVSVFIKVSSVYGDSVGGEFVQDRESATLEYRCSNLGAIVLTEWKWRENTRISVICASQK